MSLNYQLEGSHVADYHCWSLPGVPFLMRGPAINLSGASPIVGFLGQAQTFGTFAQYPFANLVTSMCSARPLNFGRGGAGPGFYIDNQFIVDYVNDHCKCCVIQVMSARSSVSNDYMESTSGLASVYIKKGQRSGETLMAHKAFEFLSEELSFADFRELVTATRERYLEQFEKLLKLIRVPKVLLYVSKNSFLDDEPNENMPYRSLVGGHPHMVTRSMVARLSSFAEETVVVFGDKGQRNRLLNRFDGQFGEVKRTTSIKDHRVYISPYMHVKVAAALYESVSKAISR